MEDEPPQLASPKNAKIARHLSAFEARSNVPSADRRCRQARDLNERFVVYVFLKYLSSASIGIRIKRHREIPALPNLYVSLFDI
jgi:hypothetical protein